MPMTFQQMKEWQQAKKDRLLPIVYVRGFAMTASEIDDTTADPFNGFNVGSVLTRTGWTGESTRHIFESPVLRLAQPPFGYRLVFSQGIRGLGAETLNAIRDWTAGYQELVKTKGDADMSPPTALVAIYRYYDDDSRLLGSNSSAGMETYGWGLGRLITDILDVTGAGGVYIVAHSMGGLVARTFLQNERVLDENFIAPGNKRTAAVEDLNKTFKETRLTQAQWERARKSVRRFFTFGTPHNGITGQGGLGNSLIARMGQLGSQSGNFDRERMKEYLGNPPFANSLDGKFDISRMFCLVGTGAADYPVLNGVVRTVVGDRSDGLVEIDNAVACAPATAQDIDEIDTTVANPTVLAARAYVRRAHSGPYGMVNSEEGFGNLARFLFGDLRVDGRLEVDAIALPREVQEKLDAGRKIRASYTFESFLRLRGEKWAMTERLARDGTATFRRFDELFPEAELKDATLTAKQERLRQLHRRIDLFTAYLDPRRVVEPGRKEKLADGSFAEGAMGFAFRLRIAVPDYRVDGLLWQKDHYEGSALLDRDLAFLAYKDGAGDWQLAWGDNVVGTEALQRVEPTADPGTARRGSAPYRLQQGETLTFMIPLEAFAPSAQPADKPIVRVWLRLVARLIRQT